MNCAEIRDRKEFLSTVENMLDRYHYWLEKYFDRLCADLGNYNEFGLFLSIVELLWKRSSSDKIKLKMISGLWTPVAKGLSLCGLSPSKCVRQILFKIIQPSLSSMHFDVSFDVLYF